MSDLSKARGLNSIADPRKFKGAPGRGRRGGRPATPASTDPVEPVAPIEPAGMPDERSDQRAVPAARAGQQPHPERNEGGRHDGGHTVATAPSARTPDPARVGDPGPERGLDRGSSVDWIEPAPVDEAAPRPRATPHRAVTPGIQRKRRELSIPHALAEALEATMINPADIVMKGYRKHADAIYAGEGGRMMARGRTRLRLSISDTEFDQITRLGLARGWNRSETVSVILAMELATVPPVGTASAADRTGIT
jgi:hypothetical protein